MRRRPSGGMDADDGCGDMINLPTLEEASMVDNLRRRFDLGHCRGYNAGSRACTARDAFARRPEVPRGSDGDGRMAGAHLPRRR